MEFCECPQCITHCLTDTNGSQRWGKFISKRTKRKHHIHNLSHPSESLRIQEDYQSELSNPSSTSSIVGGMCDMDFINNDSDTSHQTVIDETSLVFMVALFLAWLHLFCNLSREKCQLARNFIMKIIKRSEKTTQRDSYFDIPKDTQTLINISVPKISLRQTIHCPSCYLLYPTTNVPWKCTYQETINCKPCDSALFVDQHSFRSVRSKGKFRREPYRMMQGDIAGVSTPKSYYVTQSMRKWLEWFLSLDYVEDEIAQWSDKMNNQRNDKIIDIQQGLVWQQMKWASNENMEGSLRLCFSLFVDWFNPRTNKLAGKQQSMGIVCLACLNLPPEMRNKVENVFLAGIMPGPNSPNMTTVSQLLSPLVDDLLDLVGPLEMKTFKHSQGRKIEVRLLTLIGDTGATHKYYPWACT
ncbi:hypothetical protein O181_002292 [Austropuccinia psidii MF-1]|uniref:Uncharacterized protein n=1 Tax=Austropuccinia psidii MF-1 TaxID=1389203 RepID=A0A9Q3BC68_9BASI|nr:hypothetical protein [Austropuccinia psidii MF-1]